MSETILLYSVTHYIFQSELRPNRDLPHNYDTRNLDNTAIPLYRHSETQSTIFYQGILLWNNLPADIKNLRSKNSFVQALKRYYIDSY